MLFPDYTETGVVYHVININDFKKVRSHGLRYDHKLTYKSKYQDFHEFLNRYKPEHIPQWVDRERAIFASLNFAEEHQWHSHSILLSLEVDQAKCWVANENKANIIYEPFVLRSMEEFKGAETFLRTKAVGIINEYWQTSLSFEDNLMHRRDKQQGYDAEVMIFHPVIPEDIKCVAIISDHQMITVEEWKDIFCRE